MSSALSHPQVPVQPVSAAGPEHSKPLEKAESLFSQERDPRFGEIFPGISTGGSQPWAHLPRLSLLQPSLHALTQGTSW